MNLELATDLYIRFYIILDIYYAEIQELKLNKGLALQDILTEVHSYVVKSMYCAQYVYTEMFVITNKYFFSRFS